MKKYFMRELVEKLEVSARTVRYYQELGILPYPEKLSSEFIDSDSRYALYPESFLNRISLVQTLKKSSRLTLLEIKEIVAVWSDEEIEKLFQQKQDYEITYEEIVAPYQQIIAHKKEAEAVAPDDSALIYLAKINNSSPQKNNLFASSGVLADSTWNSNDKKHSPTTRGNVAPSKNTISETPVLTARHNQPQVYIRQEIIPGVTIEIEESLWQGQRSEMRRIINFGQRVLLNKEIKNEKS